VSQSTGERLPRRFQNVAVVIRWVAYEALALGRVLCSLFLYAAVLLQNPTDSILLACRRNTMCFEDGTDTFSGGCPL
jgi:hypothetical protein